jgi:hypothetical protein
MVEGNSHFLNYSAIRGTSLHLEVVVATTGVFGGVRLLLAVVAHFGCGIAVE